MALPGHRLRVWPRAALVGLGSVLLCAVLVSVGSTAKKRQVEKRWAPSLGSEEEIASRDPSIATNEAARNLERLVAAIGIDLVPRSVEGRERPSLEQAELFEEVKDPLDLYLDRQIEQSRRAISPPPESVAEFLASHADRIERVRNVLLEGETPRWELRLDEPSEVPLPNLLGHLSLHRLLLADALARERAGDHEVAVTGLEASWKLNAAIRNDPLLLTQLVSIHVARMQEGALRQLNDPSPLWRDRLFEHDFPDSLLEALRFEGWMWLHLDEAPELYEASGAWQKLFWSAMRPYARFSLADISERYRLRLERLAGMGTQCDRDLRNSGFDLTPSVPRWNLIGQIVLSDFTDLPSRSIRLQLDLELTARIVELRSARGQNNDDPRDTPSIRERSLACPQDYWMYETKPDGTVSLSFSRPLSWSDLNGVVLPTSFDVSG